MTHSLPPRNSKLRELGFEFKGNRLCSIHDGSPFQFAATERRENDRERYEAVAEAVTQEIYRMIEARNLQRHIFDTIKVKKAMNQEQKQVSCFFFHTENIYEAPKLLILIHGSGAVRAGIWSRRVLINNGVVEGSQLPYIDYAIQSGFAVLVLNTNENAVDVPICVRSAKHFFRLKPKLKRIVFLNSATPEQHAQYVWENIVRKTVAQQIAIVAHSYGGHVTLSLAARFSNDFESRVAAICFTDSAHFSHDVTTLPRSVHEHILKVTRNWVTSKNELDKLVARASANGQLECVSAGDERHEWTAYKAFFSVFRFIDERLKSNLLTPQPNPLSRSYSMPARARQRVHNSISAGYSSAAHDV